jgi:RNAse (barnase) inhibitor barstar
MRTHLEIIEDIYGKLESSNLLYELKSLRNELSDAYTFTELVLKAGSILLRMEEKLEVQKAIGPLINELLEFSKANGIFPTPSKFYSLEQKVFKIDGDNITDLKGFYDAIGNQLVEKNEWGKNWDALNDILYGGFIKTEYCEPFKIIWLNSKMSKSRLRDFEDIVKLIKEHDHIDLELK